MKRILAILALLTLGASVALAGVTETAVSPGGEKHMAPAKVLTVTMDSSASSTVYSDAIDLWASRIETAFFGVQYAVTSVVGSVVLTSLNYQCSNDGTNYATPDGVSNLVASVTDENQHYVSLKPAPCRYLRFATVTGAGATDTVTTLKLYLR